MTLIAIALICAVGFGVPAYAQTCAPLRVRNPAGNYIVPGVQGDIPYSGDQALDAYIQRGEPRGPQ